MEHYSLRNKQGQQKQGIGIAPSAKSVRDWYHDIVQDFDPAAWNGTLCCQNYSNNWTRAIALSAPNIMNNRIHIDMELT
jgi:hypothetical protein